MQTTARPFLPCGRAGAYLEALMEVQRCFFLDGVHLYGPPDCVHVKPPEEDELGPVIPPGWTVQQGPINTQSE